MSNEKALADFEAAIANFPDAMAASMTCIARKGAGRPYIVKARINLHSPGTPIVQRSFDSQVVFAETFSLTAMGVTTRQVIDAALKGSIMTPQGEVAFLAQSMGNYSATFIPLHPEVLAQQTRTGVLQIRGSDQADHWQNTDLDWELRSANTPYDSLNELSIDFGLGGLVERYTIVEAVASSAVLLDLSGFIDGTQATLGLFALKDLDRSKISLGYRVLDKGTVVSRASITGESFCWVDEAFRDVGSTNIEVPPAALVNCYARYADITYHSGWIADPKFTQNARRSTYERFDPGLAMLSDLLSTKDKRFARDFESAIESLLWMLGFGTCHLGGTKVLQDGPDILGTTPTGHLVVVECTIGRLKTDSKMATLLSRTAAVRDQLVKSGHTHLRALPIMVTALSRSEIAAEIKDATSNGVYVITADDFSDAIAGTLILPHADRLFTEAEQSVQDAKASLN